MRLDKFLKVSRIIKRRTVATSQANSERIKVNGNIAKPSKDIKVGDVITINYFKRTMKLRVLIVEDNVKACDAEKMYQVIEIIENEE